MRTVYILLALTFVLRAQADYGMEEWVFVKVLPDDNYGDAIDIEVDDQGYVYATGYYGPDDSSRNYFTTKLDNDGNEIWFVTYNGPADGFDAPHDVEVDSDGFVYVTGGSDGVATGRDICTIKYDPNGNEKWIRRYDGPVNDEDAGDSIIVTDSGDIIVAGYTVTTGTDRDYIVIRYNADGDEIWTVVYDGPAGGRDYVDGMVTDGYGNIYITGQSDGVGTDADYCTIKYNSDGEEEWVARYNGTGNGFDRPMAGVALDSEGNVLVSGMSKWGRSKYCTIKYDNDGNELWAAYYDGTGLTDWAYDIAVDENGGASVTGLSWLVDFDFESCTVKYDDDGNEIWAKRGDLDNSPSIAVDGNGDVYCCGNFYPEADAAVVKYACGTGETQWRAEYDGPESSLDCLISITIDKRGDIFGCGVCNMPFVRYGLYTYPFPQSISDILVIKYSHTVSVELLTFSVVPRDERVVLEWEVSAAEGENVEGFNLYRRDVTGSGANRVAKADGPAKKETGGWTKINTALITGANPYSYVDDDVEPGVTYEYELEAVSNGTAKTLGTATATTGAGLPTTYALYQSRPNPTTGTATIAFDLPEDAEVTLAVYDISGRKVSTLVDETLAAGEYDAEVSGLAPGVYVYKLDAADFTAVKRMVVIE